jgi:regulator of extracellular matrix RemA (YlzA/DUF370 family)
MPCSRSFLIKDFENTVILCSLNSETIQNDFTNKQKKVVAKK